MGTNGGPVQCARSSLGRRRHICAFFNGFDEQHRVLWSFIKEGFEQRRKPSTSWAACRSSSETGSSFNK